VLNSISRSQRGLITAAVYLLVVASALGISTMRLRAQSGAVETQVASGSASTAEYKPYFSLSTNRTYGTADRARVWINYVGIDHMDIRVYRVGDPVSGNSKTRTIWERAKRSRSLRH